jgi:sterol 3beta-glucosyltransferase
MKIALVTLGSRGDLQPFIALGLGLQQSGYDVLLISSKNDAAFAESFGLAYHPLDVDIRQLMADQTVRQMAKGSNPISFLVSHLKSSSKLKALMVSTQEAIWVACQDADALIYHPGMANAYFMARELGIPGVLASPFPIGSTGQYPSILFYDGPRLGKSYNRLTHFLFEHLFWGLVRPAAQAFWRAHGKPNQITRQPVSQLQVASGLPVLLAYSQQLFPRPTDWPASVQVTGYWHLPTPSGWTPPAELVNFLQAGPPPVYIGFGSMSETDAVSETLNLIVAALSQTKQRAVVSLGQVDAATRESLPDSVFLIDQVPHNWLFPRVSAVVHHGGAGTTGTGLLTGRPTLIIPHTGDQPAWGRRIYELGIGPKPIPRKKLTSSQLADGLTKLTDPERVGRAARLGQHLAAEDGVANAVGLINTYLRSQ